MPLRARKPRRIIPTTLSDAIDGSHAPAGAMALLTNLIPQPNSRGVFVPRPAMVPLTAIPNAAGQATAQQASGDDFFGMAPNTLFPGQDAPFFYESDTNSFVTISGLAAGLLPATQPAAGAWTPPTIAPVAGRVIFTHPGFPGGNTQPPSWFETLVSTTNGSAVVAGPYALGTIPGIVGENIYGSGIPAGATVRSIAYQQVSTTATGSAASTTFTVANPAGIIVGQQILGPGEFSSWVVGVSGNTITIPTPLGQNLSSSPVTFSGYALTLSAPATATASKVDVDIVSNAAIKFGWLDSSSFTANVIGNTIGGVPIITGFPLITGIQPGQTVSGLGIVAGTVVEQTANVNFMLGVTTTSGSQTVNIVSQGIGQNPGGIAVGQMVSGVGIPAGSTIIGVNLLALQFTLSQPAASTGETDVTVSGAIIVLSQGAGGTQTQTQVTIAGGTPTAPLWGAGDLNINPIAGTGPPIFVAAYNGRADYGVDLGLLGQSLQCSDAGSPCTQTFISQTLNLNTRAPLTAAAGGDLTTLLGGVVAGLFIFQGDQAITQITGDFSTSNISVQDLPVSASTFAPNSIVNTPRGLMFVATDGVRMIMPSGAIADPLGASGAGMLLPFLCASVPSRIAAAYNENVYRITVMWQPPQTAAQVWGAALRTDEFWLHLPPLGQPLERAAWSGPHASTAALIAPLSQFSSFLVAPLGAPGSLYRSDPFPTAATGYSEFSEPLQCEMQTLLMPDNPEAYANMIVETTVWLGIQSGLGNVLVTATDDMGETLNQAYVWIGPQSVPAQRAVLWGEPLIFRQIALSLATQASAYLQIGPIAIREQPLGYQLPYPIPQEAIINESILDGGDVAA